MADLVGLRKGFFRLLTTLAVLAAIVMTLAFIQIRRHLAVLQSAVAELDEREPGWRLEDLEKNRRVVADVDNGALVVSDAFRRIPKELQNRDDEWEMPPPATRLWPETAKKINDDLTLLAEVIAESRKLVDCPFGRFEFSYGADCLVLNLKDQHKSTTIADLMQMDACAALERDRPERAVASIRTILILGRYFEDEPCVVSTLLRLSLQRKAVALLERTLAQGSLGDADLASLQSTFADEAASPRLLLALKSERASMFGCFNYYAAYEKPVSHLVRSFFRWPAPEPNPLDWIADLQARPTFHSANAWQLRHLTEVIEAARLPGAARYDAIYRLSDACRAARPNGNRVVSLDFGMQFAVMLVPGYERVAELDRKTNTQLDCATVAIAAERFRRKESRWPTSLDELVQTKLLAVVPEDLFDGDRLRLRRADDGIVIHAVGPNGINRGDALDRMEDYDPNCDRPEFRLWDVEHRAQPAIPPRKRVEPAP